MMNKDQVITCLVSGESQAKFSKPFFMSCEWGCGFRTSIEMLLQAFSKDLSIASRCHHYSYNIEDRNSLINFIIEKNRVTNPNLKTPLAALYESLCRWEDLPCAPELLCDLTPQQKTKPFVQVLQEDSFTTKVWFITSRRCHCVTKMNVNGDYQWSCPEVGAGAEFLDSPNWAVRLSCSNGQVFGWSRAELDSLDSVRLRWLPTLRYVERPKPLLSDSDIAKFAGVDKGTVSKRIFKIFPSFS